MDDFLAQLGELAVTLLPVVIGAALTFIASLITSRSARLTARETGATSVAVAKAEQANQRRIKLDEITYRDRRALVDEMLEHLRRHELQKGDPRALDWGADRSVLDYQAEGAAIADRMRAVFPLSVTDAAESAVKVVADAAQASRVRRWKRGVGRGSMEQFVHFEEWAMDGRDACKRSRNEFLVEVQKSMTRVAGEAE